jgi:purine-binding chemotaxis protein CheW
VAVEDINRDGILQLAELTLNPDVIVLATPEIAGPALRGGRPGGGRRLAAALSTADGLLLTIANALSHDVYYQMINPQRLHHPPPGDLQDGAAGGGGGGGLGGLPAARHHPVHGGLGLFHRRRLLLPGAGAGHLLARVVRACFPCACRWRFGGGPHRVPKSSSIPSESDRAAVNGSFPTRSVVMLQAAQSATGQESDESGFAQELLTFTLGAEEYAIDILKVQEIRGYDAVTTIANAPGFIKGVINLRGTIVPIVDLRIKFAVGVAEYTPFTVVIILNIGGRVVGMVVDAVSDVIALKPDQIRPAPDFASSVDTAYIMGLGALGERMLIVVDIERLMLSSEMALVDEASH